MLMIRLARRGKKNSPFFRIIVSEKGRDTYGKSLEILGHFNPMAKERNIHLESERIRYWLSQGAKASPTIHNLLVDEKVIEGVKIKKKLSSKKKTA